MAFTIENGILLHYEEEPEVYEVTVPDGVTAIGKGAFWRCQSPERILLPESVRELGKGAFAHCSYLKEIHLPEGLTAIPEQCFYDCQQLETVNIPPALEKIGPRAFGLCGIRAAELKDCTLGSFAFSGSKLERLTGQDLLIGANAFDSCLRLRAVRLEGEICLYPLAFNGCTMMEELYFPVTVQAAENAFRGVTGLKALGITEDGVCRQTDENETQYLLYQPALAAFHAPLVHAGSREVSAEALWLFWDELRLPSAGRMLRRNPYLAVHFFVGEEPDKEPDGLEKWYMYRLLSSGLMTPEQLLAMHGDEPPEDWPDKNLLWPTVRDNFSLLLKEAYCMYIEENALEQLLEQKLLLPAYLDALLTYTSERENHEATALILEYAHKHLVYESPEDRLTL